MHSFAFRHPRIDRFATILGVPRYGAVGLYEALLHLVAGYAKDGYVGKYRNKDIAAELWWSGDGDQLVNAMVEAGWLTRRGDGGLVFDRVRYARDGQKSVRWVRLQAAGGDVGRRLRMIVFESDNHRCRRCLATEDLTVDHIVPVSRGGRTERGNLQTLCRSCNSRKGDRIEAA